jgi:ADP-ribose pyrophosphatase
MVDKRDDIPSSVLGGKNSKEKSGRPVENIWDTFIVAEFYKTGTIERSMKLKEKFIRRLKQVNGNAVNFRIDEVRLPNNKRAQREYLDHPGAVAVVAFPSPGKILMVKQFRHPVGEITWEIPAGKLAKGENPLACVKRELEEETGFRAGRVKKLIAFWPTAAFANEVIHIYTATHLKPGVLRPDEDEFLGCETWPLSKAVRFIKSGKIKDSKTIIAVLAVR